MGAFIVKGREYEFPTTFRVCDPVLVRDVTGLTFQEFTDILGNDDDSIDPVVLAGLVAVGIWQKFPTWKRQQVVSYVQQITADDFQLVPTDEDGPPEAAPAVPLSPSETDSPGSSDDLSNTPESS